MTSCLVALAGCSKGAQPAGDAGAAGASSASQSATSSSAALSSAAAAAPGSGTHRFEVKSGIVQMTNSMFQKMEQTLYFDDYGAKQAISSSMDMTLLGKAIHTENVDIDADGYRIHYEPLKKTGTRQKLAPGAVPSLGGGTPPIDVRNLTEEMKKQMKVETLPPKTIDGKEASGIYAETMGIKTRVWSWKGIALYTETDMSGMNLGGMLGTKAPPKNHIKLPPPTKSAPIVIEAKSVQVDVPVPESRFTVPPDVKITEM